MISSLTCFASANVFVAASVMEEERPLLTLPTSSRRDAEV
jgi:hypothetical protein